MAFGFSFPKLPTQALAGDPTQPGGSPGLFGASSGLSLPDKLMMFGAIAKGHPEMAMQIPLMAAARRQFQVQQAATSDLARATSGQPVPSRAEIAAGMDPENATPPAPAQDTPAGPPLLKDGDPYGMASGIPALPAAPKINPVSTYVPPRDPAADVGGSGDPVSVRSALPMLSRLAKAGGNIEPWTKMLEAAQPKSVVVNGRVLDERNPAIYGQFYGDAPTKGAEPVYDGNGKQVGWHMADGAIQAIQSSAQATSAGTKAGELPYAGPIAQATSAGTEAGKLPYTQASAAAAASGKAIGEAPYTLITKDVNGVPTTMTQAQALALAGAGASPASAAPPTAAGNSRLDPQAFFKGFVLPHEGGLNPADLNGSPTNFGFNQAANPDIDVHKLTPDTAASRFADKYFAQSGAADLPAPLAAVHADTYFINPAKAQQILQASGGDPGKYMDLRSAWLQHIAQTNPNAAKYGPVWAKRDADLRAVSQQLSGQQPVDQAAPLMGGATVPTAPPAGPPGFHGLNADDQKAVDAAKADALQAEDVARMGHQFQDLNRQQATGPGFRPLHIPIPLLDRVDLNPIGALARQYQTGVPAMENLSMRLATGIRAPGQRLTQAEIMKNLESVPNLRNLPAQNDTAIAGYDERAATKRNYANFVSDWLTQHGSLNGADTAWAAQQKGGASAAAAAPASASAPRMGAQPQQIRVKSGGIVTVVPVG